MHSEKVNFSPLILLFFLYFTFFFWGIFSRIPPPPPSLPLGSRRVRYIKKLQRIARITRPCRRCGKSGRGLFENEGRWSCKIRKFILRRCALVHVFYFRSNLTVNKSWKFNKFLMLLSQSVSEKFLNVYHYLEMVSNFTVKIRIKRCWP